MLLVATPRAAGPRRLKLPGALAMVLMLVACGRSGSQGPPQVAMAPVNLSPAVGRARIVVWRPSRMFESGSVVVAVDSQRVGDPASGSAVMLDVLPGPHHRSSRSDDRECAVVMEMQADSTYIFRVSSQAGFLIAEPGLARVDRARVAAALQHAGVTLVVLAPLATARS